MKSLETFVDCKEVPGYVAAIYRSGKVEIEAYGTRTSQGEPLETNSIFRITSMTKPIAAVMTLLLVDQGKLNLQDPIERWLPELANRKVLKQIDGPVQETVPAKRSITVEDLLSFRMGFGMIMDFSNLYLVLKEFEKLDMIGLGAPDPNFPLPHDEWLKRFATLPLMVQPGEMWQYNTAYYLLSVFLSRVTGKKLDELFKESIFDPLGMKDTSFVIPKEKISRFTDCYWFDSENQKLEIFDPARDSMWMDTPAFFDAAAGLLSTAGDYLKFAKMLLNKGEQDGKQFLSASLVDAMTRNQLTPEQRLKPTFDPNQWKHHGYGYGVSVRTEETKTSQGKEGQYGWDGGFGSTWRNDPKAGLIGVLLTERTFDSPALPPICEKFWDEVYQK